MKKFTRAMVTGASRGLGEEIAKQLGKRCENFVLVARDESALLKLKETLVRDFDVKGEIDILLVDLTKKEAVQVIANYKKDIDLLINNAGLGFVNHFEKMSAQELDQMIMVNNYALTMLTHHFCSQMIKKGRGEIINVASVAGFLPMPLFSVYGATKSYVISFSRALDCELKGKGVRVKAICPGGIKTQFHVSAGLEDKIVQENQRFMETPENIARDIMSLIESDSDLFTPRYYNKLVGVLSRVLPTPFLARQTKEMYRKYLGR
ncbi:MAG: SDR family NAD(P)-dependent oxidoreductase [Bacteriovorax sp.]